MPSTVNPMTSLGIGLSIANDANDRAAHAEQRARDAELQAFRNSGGRPASTDSKLKAERDNALQTANALFRAMEEKDALITEWMHSNEAFKRLARQYGKKLGVSDEQRTQDFRSQLVDIAEEDPKYAKTDVGIRAKTNLGK